MLDLEKFGRFPFVNSFRPSMKTSPPSILNSVSTTARSSRLFARPKKKKRKTKSVASVDRNFDSSEASPLPANLKRKVEAKRPPLGHIVPEATRAKGCELD